MRSRLAALGLAIVLAACSSSAPGAPTATPTSTLDASFGAPASTSAPSTAPTTEPSTTASPSEDHTTPEAPTTPAVVRGPIDAGRALGFATALATEVGERVPGTPGDVEARRRVTEELVAAGWQVDVDPVPLPQGGETANLIATVGGLPPDGPVVVVGGHLDTLGGPGANDNASGVAVVVEVASELADEAADLAIPLVLVAFGAEERQEAPGRPNHLGSEQLAAALDGRTVAMLSVDMVGNGPTTRIMGLDGTDRTLVDRVAGVAAVAGIPDVETGSRGNVSDHGAFALRGVPAAFLWTGPDDRLHTPADTPEALDVTDLARAGAITLAFLRDLGAADVDGLEGASPGGD